MMTAAAFRKLALSMEGAHEEPHFERASFRIGKKIFATLTRDGTEAMVTVKEPGEIDRLLTSFPDAFFSYGGWTIRNGSLGVRLAEVDPALLRRLLKASWMRIAPKKA